MRPRRLALVVSSMFVLPACGRSAAADSAWVKRPVVVDGKGDEWSDVDSYHTNDGALIFSLQNDATDLYFLFSTGDPALGHALAGAGFVVWLDDRSPRVGVRVATGWRGSGGPRPEIPASEKRPTEGTAPDEGEADAGPPPAPGGLHFELVDASGKPLPGNPGAAAAGIHGAVTSTISSWTYEVSLPLSLLTDGKPAASLREVALRVELGRPPTVAAPRHHEAGGTPGGVPGAVPGSGMGGGAGGPGGGMGGPGGGRGGHHGGPEGRGARRTAPQEELRMRVVLAAAPRS